VQEAQCHPLTLHYTVDIIWLCITAHYKSTDEDDGVRGSKFLAYCRTTFYDKPSMTIARGRHATGTTTTTF